MHGGAASGVASAVQESAGWGALQDASPMLVDGPAEGADDIAEDSGDVAEDIDEDGVEEVAGEVEEVVEGAIVPFLSIGDGLVLPAVELPAEGEQWQIQVYKKDPRPRGVRGPWAYHATVPLEYDVCDSIREWLKQNKHFTAPLASTKREKKPAWIAKCDGCRGCDKQFCFHSVDGSSGRRWLVVEAQGKCVYKESDPATKNIKRLSLEWAVEYAVRRNLTPESARSKMRGLVPDDEIPTTDQLKWQRKTLRDKAAGGFTASCIGALQLFIENPPPGVHIFGEHVAISEQVCRILFAVECALEYHESCTLTSFLMDFTFQTNVEGLLLGCAGPVGLFMTKRLPSMRFAPVIFMLTESEDEDAHLLCATLLKEHRARSGGPAYVHAFLDCKCFATMAKEHPQEGFPQSGRWDHAGRRPL